MEIITASRLRAFRACKRLHFFRYELMRRPTKTADALRFGSLFHRGLEAWWIAMRFREEGESDLAPLEQAIAAMAPREDDAEDVTLDEFDLAKATALMQGYHARWFAETSTFEILGVEVQFLGPLLNPATGAPSRTFRLGGKIDALVRRPGETKPWLVEHKTSSEDLGPGAVYWQKLRLDGQVSTYFDGAASLGLDVGGCLYDVVRKPAMRPRLATPVESRRYTKKDGKLDARQREEDESPGEYADRIREAIVEDPGAFFQRGDVVRLDDVLREHGIDRWADARSLRDAQLSRAHPTNPDACELHHRLCDYWPVCTGTAAIDDPTLYKIAKKHSELDLPDEAESTAEVA